MCKYSLLRIKKNDRIEACIVEIIYVVIISESNKRVTTTSCLNKTQNTKSLDWKIYRRYTQNSVLRLYRLIMNKITHLQEHTLTVERPWTSVVALGLGTIQYL